MLVYAILVANTDCICQNSWFGPLSSTTHQTMVCTLPCGLGDAKVARSESGLTTKRGNGHGNIASSNGASGLCRQLQWQQAADTGMGHEQMDYHGLQSSWCELCSTAVTNYTSFLVEMTVTMMLNLLLVGRMRSYAKINDLKSGRTLRHQRFRLQHTWRLPNPWGSSLVLPKIACTSLFRSTAQIIRTPEIPLGRHKQTTTTVLISMAIAISLLSMQYWVGRSTGV